MPINELNILCLGDIVGASGMAAVEQELPDLVTERSVDFIVANIENSASGYGFNHRIYRQLKALNVDAFTTGNHVYAKREVMDRFNDYDQLLRPHNFPKAHPGTGVRVFQKNNHKIAVINLIGRVFMQQFSDCPFKTMDEVLAKLDADIIIVDFHAETTSEKQALGWYLKDKVTLFFGTHTHVQTNDARLLSSKTAYLSDLGMCGAYDSVIGMDMNVSIRKFITQLPDRHRPVNDATEAIMGGLFLSFNTDTRQVTHFEGFNKVVPINAN
ncbi:MAG: TIGR00282 family metallophosphoesterase [Candidatus Margulisiibacteriota bacterium]